jgi:hypothetical protein
MAVPNDFGWLLAHPFSLCFVQRVFSKSAASRSKNGQFDPVEGSIIPLGGAATVLIASIPFSPCRRLKITICSGGPGGSSPWLCPRRCWGAIRFARSMWPVGDRAPCGGTDGDGVSGRQAGPRDR